MTTSSPSELKMAVNYNIDILTQLSAVSSNNESAAESSYSSDEDSSVTYSTYEEICYLKMKDEGKLRVLLAMIIGSNCDKLKNIFDEHVKAGRLQKASVCLRGKIEYLDEINR